MSCWHFGEQTNKWQSIGQMDGQAICHLTIYVLARHTWNLKLGTGSIGSTASTWRFKKSNKSLRLLLDHWDVRATFVVNLNVCMRAKVLTNGACVRKSCSPSVSQKCGKFFSARKVSEITLSTRIKCILLIQSHENNTHTHAADSSKSFLLISTKVWRAL